MNKITVSELLKQSEEYTILDIREKTFFEQGHIRGAISFPITNIDEIDIPNNKKVVAYCKDGTQSEIFVDKLTSAGYDAKFLLGGYIGWIDSYVRSEADDEFCLKAESSIRKKFHKGLWTPFAKAIKAYDLIKEGDKIAVCISGGKDSMLMAKLFQELKRHNKFPFELVFLVMDPGYSLLNKQVIEANSKKLNVPVTIFKSDIFESVFNIEKSPCYICARMRRGHLYAKAKELGCNKIALGHHYDDVIETILMGMLYGGQIQTMMPKLKSTNFEGMELIRPMYFIREEDIIRWRDYNDLYFLQCACKFTEAAAVKDNENMSKRKEIKNLIAELKKTNPFVESNIFKSVENVNLSTIIAYKKNGKTHRFLDTYDD